MVCGFYFFSFFVQYFQIMHSWNLEYNLIAYKYNMQAQSSEAEVLQNTLMLRKWRGGGGGGGGGGHKVPI